MHAIWTLPAPASMCRTCFASIQHHMLVDHVWIADCAFPCMQVQRRATSQCCAALVAAATQRLAAAPPRPTASSTCGRALQAHNAPRPPLPLASSTEGQGLASSSLLRMPAAALMRLVLAVSGCHALRVVQPRGCSSSSSLLHRTGELAAGGSSYVRCFLFRSDRSRLLEGRVLNHVC